MLERFDVRGGAELIVPNTARPGWVVLHEDGAGNISVYSWGDSEQKAIDHGMSIRRVASAEMVEI